MSIDGLAGLARKLAEWVRNPDRATKDVLLEDGLGRVLRESKLGELIAAGQAMRDCNYINTTNSLRWDAALAAFLAATDSIPPEGRK